MEKYHLYSWFQTSFDIPADWPTGNRVLINFGAVDYEATVFVNGKRVGFHRGGYFEFTFDVTDYLSKNGTNELWVDRETVQLRMLTLTHQDWCTLSTLQTQRGIRFPSASRPLLGRV